MTNMKTSPIVPPAIRRGLALSGPLCLCVACASPFSRPDADAIGPPLQQLHEVETIRLADKSRSEPVSVEDAAAEAIEQLIKPEPPAETAELSLADVRAAALTNNLDLTVELLNPSIAQSTVSEEEAKFEATLTGSARRSLNDSPTALGIEASSSTFTSYDLGVRVPLRSGGFATVNLPFSESDTNNPFALLNPAFNTDLRFSISQPLLRGAWAPTSTYSIRVARHQRKITDARTKLTAIRILANADRAYWLLYAARRELEVRQQQYELAVEQLQQARRKVAVGDTAPIEITRAESGVAQRLEAIIIAQTTMRLRERDLKRIMNRADLDMSAPTTLVPTTNPEPVFLDLDPIALGEYALANRMEMLELELQLAIDASTIDLQRNAALPLFSVDYTYNINGLGTSYSNSFDQIADRSFEDWSVGLTAEIPIGNEAAKARVHGAILARLQRLATRDQRRTAILQETYDAVDRLQQNWQRILAARQEAILAGRTYEAEQRQFAVGIRTSTDVLDAAARLADAQSREVRALADYQIATVDIAFATGTLLGHDRVHWEPIDTESD